MGIVTKAGHYLMKLITPCLLYISGGKQFSPELSQNSVNFDSPIGRASLSALIHSEIIPVRLKLGFANIPCKDKGCVGDSLPSSMFA